MAAMRQADSDNMSKLRLMWPELYDEMLQRYNAPGGILVEDGITDIDAMAKAREEIMAEWG